MGHSHVFSFAIRGKKACFFRACENRYVTSWLFCRDPASCSLTAQGNCYGVPASRSCIISVSPLSSTREETSRHLAWNYNHMRANLVPVHGQGQWQGQWDCDADLNNIAELLLWGKRFACHLYQVVNQTGIAKTSSMTDPAASLLLWLARKRVMLMSRLIVKVTFCKNMQWSLGSPIRFWVNNGSRKFSSVMIW